MKENSFISKIKNVFSSRNKDPTYIGPNVSYASSYRPEKPWVGARYQSIATPVYSRIAMDAASVSIKHVRLDINGKYAEDLNSGLNKCLNIEANVDQTGRSFIQDVVYTMLVDGYVAIVPVDVDQDQNDWSSVTAYQIESMRVGTIIDWYPYHVRVSVYNSNSGQKEEIILPKSGVGIIENPFYCVMNEPNSTMQRLVNKTRLLDITDERSCSGKLDIIIQLPFAVKTALKKEEAERRKKILEDQLANSLYGIGYIDQTEHITQLNRPAENNLNVQVQYLTSLLYSQLGITQEILNGTASEEVMLNYNKRTIEPIVNAIADELYRKFITKTGRSQRQNIMYFSEPFKLVPLSQMAELMDKLTRNEIMTSNEMRQIIGLPPANDPRADKLINKNLNNKENTNEIKNSNLQKEVD